MWPWSVESSHLLMHDPVAAGLFSAVQSSICSRKKLFEPHRNTAFKSGNSKAGSGLNNSRTRHKPSSLELRSDAVNRDDRIFEISMGQDHQKFFPAKSRTHIGLASVCS